MKRIVSAKGGPKCFKLSPSDLVFLWEDCPRCFYLKVVRGFQRPWSPMPKIFNIIHARMKDRFHGRRAEEIAPGMPAGLVDHGERWVQSSHIAIPGRFSTCFISGRFDLVETLDDGTYGIVDFKTSERKAAHVPLYGRQLHSYAYALENPAPGKLSLRPVTKLGLLVYEPGGFCGNNGVGNLEGGLTWIEVPRHDGTFMAFLDEVLCVLEQPSPPGPNADCKWCEYAATAPAVYTKAAG